MEEKPCPMQPSDSTSLDAPNDINESPIALTREVPYYAVIFTSLRTEVDDNYGDMSDLMCELAMQQPGYLGIESARGESGPGLGITVSYWQSTEAIRNWKKNVDHRAAQRKGRDQWYSNYKVRICKVERDYSFDAK